MNRRLGDVLVSLGAVCVLVALVEIVGHALVRPSPLTYGTFLGRPLPPFKVVPACQPPPPTDWRAPYEKLVVDGRRITLGDLYGINRPDPVLAYAPKESAVSVNGWWQSNNLGARARRDASRAPAPGTRRILVFGESFGAGNRVEQEQMWSAVLARSVPDTDVLNFAVDGYGMGQAYLRFRHVRAELDYDAALMMFVPKADLSRDINVYRPLLSRDWQLFAVVPRYVVANGRLVLAKRPEQSQAAFFAANCRTISQKLRAHLAKYDRFYVDAEYRKQPPVLGRSLLYKLGVTAYASYLRRRAAAAVMRQGSEARRVTKAIFRRMDDDVRRDGGKFILVFLPLESELKRLGSDTDYRTRWRAMVDSMCGPAMSCIDLADDLAKLPANQIDRGYDGTHYGPVANRRIGQFIARAIMQRNLLAAAPQKIGEYRQ